MVSKSSRWVGVACLLAAGTVWVLARCDAAPAQAAALIVRLTSPAMNAAIAPGASLALTAVAETPGETIDRVEFYDDGALVGTATRPPYAVSYRPPADKRNFSLTARVTVAAGRTAVSQPITAVVTRQVQRRYESFDYAETAEDIEKAVRLSIPEGLATVRGILVVSNPAGGDTRDWFQHAWYGEWVHRHDFAFLGTRGFTSHVASLIVLEHALARIAVEAHHPELVNAPFATTGFSAGGGFASRLLVGLPQRVIACVPVSSRINLTGLTPDAAMLGTPACIVAGGLETALPPVVAPVLATWRPQGALWGWMTVQGAGHAMVGQDVLALPFLDAAVALRYPADADARRGPLKLKTLDSAGGWLADNTTWHSGLVDIAPADAFKGDVGQSSWLPTEDVAFIYRAYATYDRPLAIVSPEVSWPTPGWDRQRVWDAGANVTLVVDTAGLPNWQTLTFYDGARQVGQVIGGPTQ